MTSTTGSEADISGVPTTLLAKVYHESSTEEYTYVARRIGIDDSWLRRIVSNQTMPIVKLHMADRICLALGLDITVLIRQGELVIVPLRRTTNAAMKIVNDEMAVREYLDLDPLTEEEQQERVDQLLADYDEHCALTKYQIARREHDAVVRGRATS